MSFFHISDIFSTFLICTPIYSEEPLAIYSRSKVILFDTCSFCNVQRDYQLRHALPFLPLCFLDFCIVAPDRCSSLPLLRVLITSTCLLWKMDICFFVLHKKRERERGVEKGNGFCFRI
ncbi:hypothetical protein RchiOBHm_Chr4g0385661 [Rosa chinensis]|uniref:Uncharacterized protein n=1 Tax=Rosa chinensis TaxID=74649 RepID=A0A2P6QNY8_ROSCH|nr:hypothetical protein RchiOBHm_Chr4g0385661 [Rosa chinensis]